MIESGNNLKTNEIVFFVNSLENFNPFYCHILDLEYAIKKIPAVSVPIQWY